MGCELIPDGYTQSDACFGLNVTFRPMPFSDYDDYMTALIAADPADRKKLIGEKVAERISAWSATLNGEPVPVTAENIGMLPAAAGQRLRNLITGQQTADDKDPGDDSKN